MKTALGRMFRGRKMDRTANEEGKPHVIVIPLGSQGHMAPLLQLSKNLARNGVAITFVCVDIQISGFIADDPELKNLDVKFFGFPRSNGMPRSAGAAAALVERGFQPLREKLIRQRSAGGLGRTVIVADMFNTWSESAASQLQIPWYVFIPSGAIVARLFQATENLFAQGKFRIQNPRSRTLQPFEGQIDITGMPALRYHELISTIHEDPLQYKLTAKIISGATGMLVNTFYDLESTAVDALRTYASTLPTGRSQKIYPIGPLVPESILHVDSSVPQGLQCSQEHCLRWLDAQPESSVLYICFGSLFQHDGNQLNSLARVLERCNQRFLWVIREHALGGFSSRAVPPGFEARVGERGCFVRGWAPQIQVLSHPSTGGFLTHCGWNSSIEAISLGVPMIGWPIYAEQYMNCRLLVDVLKIATEIRGPEDGSEEQNEISRAVQLLMVGEEGKLMRSRVKEFQAKATAAAAENGSSSQSLEEFVKKI